MAKSMGKEVKIGLVVIGSLLTILGGVLYVRLAGGVVSSIALPPDAPPGAQPAAADGSLPPAQPTLMTPAPAEGAPYGGDPPNDGLGNGGANNYPAGNAYGASYNEGNRERQEPPQSYLADTNVSAANAQSGDEAGQAMPSDRRPSFARDEDSVSPAQGALVGETSARGDDSAAAAGAYAGRNDGGLSDSQAAAAPGSYDAAPGSVSPQGPSGYADSASAGATMNDSSAEQPVAPSAPVRSSGNGGFVTPRRFANEPAPVGQGVAPPSGYGDDAYPAGGAAAPVRYAQDSGYASSAGGPPITPVAAQAPIAHGPSEPGQYVVQPNDNFWTISEKVYGAGAFFKALHRFNAADYPQSRRLQVGDVVAVPPTATLRQKFPDLCPKPNRERTASQLQPVAASPRHRLDARIYVVEQGDTLFDVARRQLGKASRWPEIYELNRGTLGDDFDYLRAGTELVMPSDGQQPQDTLTRQPSDRLQR